MSTVLGKDWLIAKTRYRQKVVHLEDGDAIVRELTDAEAAAVQKALVGAVESGRIVAYDKVTMSRRLAVRFGWIDESGEQILDPDEMDVLARMSSHDMEVMTKAIMEMTGITGLSDDDDNDVRKRAEKNSAKIQNGASDFP